MGPQMVSSPGARENSLETELLCQRVTSDLVVSMFPIYEAVPQDNCGAYEGSPSMLSIAVTLHP